ncbi:hypothetical protein [Nocardia fluminea]|uniref:hypothetical protein n=1 Tax=Nocardia fluminea TaxID=134984 RepID=UPI003D0CA2DC
MSRNATSYVVDFLDIIPVVQMKGGEVALLYAKQLPQPGPDPLVRFDLTEQEILDIVIRAAVDAADNTHPLAPPGMPGQNAYGAGVAVLRELLFPRGWKKDERGNVARTVHPGRGLAIIVAVGNEHSGMPGNDEYITTKWPKGSCALTGERFVAEGFDSIDESFPSSPTVEGAWEVWYLMHHRAADRVFVEISKPGRLNDREYPVDWLERIILDPLELGGVDINIDSDGDDHGGPEVPVIPK